MDLEKIIKENYEKYIFPYEEVYDEINSFKNLKLVTYEEDKAILNDFTLFECQKDSLINLRKNICTIVRKPRQSGYSTLIALHCYYRIKHDVINQEHNPYLLLCQNEASAQEIRKKITKFIGQCENDAQFYGRLKHDIIFATGSNYKEKTIALNFKEIWIDDAEFITNLGDVIDTLRLRTPKSKILAIFSDDEKSRKSITNVFGGKYYEGTILTQIINWWEVPSWNRNLCWYKADFDEVIDENGNIKYNKERWDKLIKEGFKPTSPRHEAYVIANNDKKILS